MPHRLVALPFTTAVVLGAVLAGAVGSVPDDTGRPPPRHVSTRADVAPRRPAVEAMAILRSWDRRRAAAYASGDPRRLRSLYAPGSWAGARDVRTLQAYADRGLGMDRLVAQVLRVRIWDRTDDLLRLGVLERVLATVDAGHDGRRTLPTGDPVLRVVTMVRVTDSRGDARGDRWVVRSVRRH